MAFPEDLANPAHNFKDIWEIVKECGEEERHFNQLQSVYRGVASTWLLATFAAVGYLLFDKEGKLSHPGVAAIVCLAGAVGIALIWILDLHVYHRLLVAVFTEGLTLEKQFPWLPRFRTNMYNIGRKSPSDDPIRRRLAAYYVWTVSALILAAILFWGMFFHSSHCEWEWYSFLLLAAVIACLLILWLFRLTTAQDQRPTPVR